MPNKPVPSFGLLLRSLLPQYSFWAPEVVQSSAMDCGPASLKCLLEGFGIPISYGRLREACQTNVDGTSITTIEEVALQLGLAAEQIMIPPDHLLLSAAHALPAMVTTCHASGFTHFVIAWNCLGPRVQVMDPATGRRWPKRSQFLNELYLHTMAVPAIAWREWAESDESLGALGYRLAILGLSLVERQQLVKKALSQVHWQPIAALDAVVRLVTSLVRSKNLPGGAPAFKFIESLWEKSILNHEKQAPLIPPAYWSISPAPPADLGEEQLYLRGALLVRIVGRMERLAPSRLPLKEEQPSAQPQEQPEQQLPKQPKEQPFKQPKEQPSKQPKEQPLSPELQAALHERPIQPWREILKLLTQDSLVSVWLIIPALAVSAAGVVLEILLFRALFDLSGQFGFSGQGSQIIAAAIMLVTCLLLFDLPVISSLLRLGRQLEVRLRLAFLSKLPHLHDRYFQSRLTGDMAERSHCVHYLRDLPSLAAQFLRTCFELFLTTLALIWLFPQIRFIALGAALLSLVIPLALNPLLSEKSLKVRCHSGALSRFHLDALLGLVAIRTHNAERSVRSEHEDLLYEWARARFDLQNSVIALEGLQALVSYALAAWLLIHYLQHGGEMKGALLLLYWGLNLPALGQTIASLARQYPNHSSILLRLLEPLGSIEEKTSSISQEMQNKSSQEIQNNSPPAGISLLLAGVTVRVAGQAILKGIDLFVEPGSHVAIVGQSGAGKSTLVGTLLGWYSPSAGQILVDGQPLDQEGLACLRRQTAWIDPAVHLWNKSLFDNLCYGTPAERVLKVGGVIQAAGLHTLLEKLPQGMQTFLGEGGALVSGGEGQRVRLARAMLRPGVRLVIFDEPFRGLDAEQRGQLLQQSRQLWSKATFLCITHDISHTLGFDRVIVLEEGRIVEDGHPRKLCRKKNSRFHLLLDLEQQVKQKMWSDHSWRTLRLEHGQLSEGKDD